MLFRNLALAMLVTLFSATQAVAAWHEAKTRHFFIYSEQKPADLRDFAARLEKFDSAVRVARNMDDPPLSDSTRLTIYVLRDQDDVASLAGYPGVAGFYLGRAGGPVAFVHSKRSRLEGGLDLHSSRSSEGDLDPETVFYHEYLHHLMLTDRAAAYPAWMIEGYAEFFATAKFEKDGSVAFGGAPNYRGTVVRRFYGLTLEEMLAGGFNRLSGWDVESIYGRGWLLTHYLAFEPKRRGQVSRYLQGIERGLKPLDAASQAFGDLRQLDKELIDYLNREKLPLQHIPASRLSVGSIAIRPLAPGEAAIMGVRLRSEIELKSSKAKLLADSARGVAARFPDDPSVQARLAIVEFHAKNYQAALAAADRAVALDPRSQKALVYKGRAMIELAKANRAAADWKAVRAPLVQANRLDPDAAEPLMLFFESYRAQGVQPPAAAVEGLLYALEVAPFDDDLRIMAVRQLLTERRLAEAKAAYSPIAYGSHSRKQSEKNLAIMAAIIAQKPDQALALIQAQEAERKAKED